MAGLTAATVVTWRSGLAARVTQSPESVAVTTRTKTVTLPSIAADAVRQLHSGKDCAVGDLTGLDDQDAIVVVRRLLREGLVVARS
jgi:hypothetical protein